MLLSVVYRGPAFLILYPNHDPNHDSERSDLVAGGRRRLFSYAWIQLRILGFLLASDSGLSFVGSYSSPLLSFNPWKYPLYST